MNEERKLFNDLKKLPISNLVIIILNDKYGFALRKCAEAELRKRIKHLGYPYGDLLHKENLVIKERGLDINNYLIRNNPDMQQLMEVYFSYCYNLPFEEKLLLFSEYHLCNDMTFCARFFDKVCDKEIKNLNRRLNNIYFKDDLLHLYMKALIKRKSDIYINKLFYYKGIDKLEYNEAFQFLDDELLLEPLSNVTDEELANINTSKITMIKYVILEMLNESLLDADIFQDLYGLKKVIEDSNRLNMQKKILYNQVKNGYKVDYNSDTMKKTLKKVKDSINF